MKKRLIFIVVLSIIFLTGCASEKEKITANTFARVLKKHNLTVADQTEVYDLYNSYLVYEDSNFTFRYIDTKSQKDIEGIYLDETNNIVKAFKTKEKPRVKNGDNWSSFEMYDDNMYYYLLWIDDTLIYVYSKPDYKDTVKNIISELE